MLDVAELDKLYAEKLLKTGSHDAARMKIVWVAYKQGLADAKEVQPNQLKENEK